jgi:hypothetical protein
MNGGTDHELSNLRPPGPMPDAPLDRQARARVRQTEDNERTHPMTAAFGRLAFAALDRLIRWHDRRRASRCVRCGAPVLPTTDLPEWPFCTRANYAGSTKGLN